MYELESMIDYIEIAKQIGEALELPFSYFINPNKRIHLLYVGTSFLLGVFVFWKVRPQQSLLQYLFPKKNYWSASAKVDYLMFLFNSFVKVFLIAPFIVGGFYLSFEIETWLELNFGLIKFQWSPFETILYYTIAITLVGDFASFFIHYLMHKIPWLWEFHKIHHSAEHLNPITQYRIHPLELFLNNLRTLIVFALVTGVFDYLSDNPIQKYLFFGVNVFQFVFLAWGANLRHSHIPLKYFNVLEYLLISPYQHQIHHSAQKELFDTNMGSKLAIWDWLFGTLKRSKEVSKLEIGVGEETKDYYSFKNILFLPFLNIWKRLTKQKASS